jgi:hypothetical protein
MIRLLALLALLLGFGPSLALAQPPAAGTVVLATGPATASSPLGEIRALQKGDAVFSGETLHTTAGSFLNVRFRDGSHTLLRPESRLEIEAFDYPEPEPTPVPAARTPPPIALAPVQTPTPERAYLRLLKGGFRAVTGAIGKLNTEDYRITTPVATIGIRGTQPFVQLVEENSPLVDHLGLPPGMAPQGGAVIGNFEGEIIVRTYPRGSSVAGFTPVRIEIAATETAGLLAAASQGEAQVLGAGQFLFVDAEGRSVPIPMPPEARETPDPSSPDCN